MFHETQTYAGDGELASPASVSFNHGLAEMFDAVLGTGLTLTGFAEHREIPWLALGEAAMTASDDHPGEYVLRQGRDRVPLSFTLQAAKPR